MENINKLNEEKEPDGYTLTDKEEKIRDFLKPRLEILKKTKKEILEGVDFEEIMKNADKEYQPQRLDDKATKGVDMLVEDETTGFRGSRLVRVNTESEDWRSTISEPTLLVKIQTALSILIDQNPEGIFKALTDKFEKRTNLAKALWKRNWELNDSIETLKLFVFDLAKYGWAVGHTLPRIIKREKEILDEVVPNEPEKNKYKKTEIVEFNDIYREILDPFRTWIDDKANLRDKYSVNDWYYEKDYSEADFKEEFGNFKNAKYVKFSSLEQPENTEDGNKESQTRKDMTTVGFYENKSKDLYIIWLPSQGIILYYAPLPNDDGKLTLWWSYWLERDSRTIYGIGLYELIKNNKVMYDRMKNMTVDQLVLAIYPMLFFTGTPMAGESSIRISPNKIQQKLAGTTIDQVDIKYDPRGWEGVGKLNEDIDEASGITKTLQGQIVGKTLGETLHAKDAALKRLNIPLINIAHAIETDAYITLSWMNQVYSIPEVKEFADEKKLKEYEIENDQEAEDVEFKEDKRDLEGNNVGKVEGEFFPKLDLSLEEDRDGVLIESPERRFFQLGRNKGEGRLSLENIKWDGKIVIKARSIISPNPELERQRKLELFNLVMPVLQVMLQFMATGDIETALGMYKPIKQILEVQDENPENWLPDKLVEMAENPEILAEVQKEKAKKENPLMIDEASLEQPQEEGQPIPKPQGKQEAETVVPPNETSNPFKKILGSAKGVFKRLSK